VSLGIDSICRKTGRQEELN